MFAVCGDKVCSGDLGESSFNCPADCAEQPAPAGFLCEEKLDPISGATFTDCTIGEQELLEVCFKEPLEVVDSCLSAGGEPVNQVDEFGCHFTKCEFAGAQTDAVFLEAQCPTQEQIDLFAQECIEQGLIVKMEKTVNGCFEPKCTGLEQTFEDVCPAPTIGEIEALTQSCSAQNGSIEYRYDEKGCKVAECIAGTASTCYQVPQMAMETCALHGGEMVILKDESGCVNYSYCLTDDGGEFEFVPIAEQELAPAEELRAIGGEINDLGVILDGIVSQLELLKDFYSGENDVQSLVRVVAASSIISNAKEELGEISEFMLTSNVRADDASRIRADFGAISQDIKEALAVLLQPPAQVGGVHECGSSIECFEKNLITCTPSTASIVEDLVYGVEISGLEGQRCAVKVSAELIFGPSSMVCNYEDYAKGFSEGAEDFFNSCEGTLLDYMLQRGGYS